MPITITTTGSIEGRQITSYLGVVAGEAILGVNIFKDITAGFRNIVGGRSGKYEEELRKARATALEEMGQVASEWARMPSSAPRSTTKPSAARCSWSPPPAPP